MSGQDRFGPTLRRIREQRGISLEQIAERTNVDLDLWAAMERNDFSRWPSGISARAFIREYARAIGVDAESTVDEFCRCFPHGDRRRDQILRAEAKMLGLPFDARDDLVPPDADRRRPPAPDRPQIARQALVARRTRLAAAGLDLVLVVGAGYGLAQFAGAPVLPVVAGMGLLYHAGGVVLLGTTPGAALAAAWLRHLAAADLRRVPEAALPRLRRPMGAARS
jgi:transcriptional regulator with XRE-family HTH domain